MKRKLNQTVIVIALLLMTSTVAIAMSNLSNKTLAALNSPKFMLACKMAFFKHAKPVLSEDSGTANHTQRLSLAKKIIASSGEVKSDSMAMSLIENETIRQKIENLVLAEGETEYNYSAIYSDFEWTLISTGGGSFDLLALALEN